MWKITCRDNAGMDAVDRTERRVRYKKNIPEKHMHLTCGLGQWIKNGTYLVKGKQDGLITPSRTKRDHGQIPRGIRTKLDRTRLIW